MVKIPSLDDLKKAGANLVDSAKSGKLAADIKARIETVGDRLTREGAELPKGSAPVQEQLHALLTTVKELNQLQAQQAVVVQKFEAQLNVLTRVIATESITPKTSVEPIVTPSTEEKKQP